MALDLSHLNEEQYEAVVTTEGPVLVLAGAGSGKTRVLTHRIAHIIEQKLAAPGEILAITFTNRAAKEMKTRLTDLLGYEPQTWVLTFHAACGRILRREAERIGLRSSFTIYDQDDAIRLTRNVMKELGMDIEKLPPRRVQGEISKAKNNLQGPSALGHLLGDDLEAQAIARVYALYQERLHAQNAVDFDDMLMLAAAVLEKYPEARSHWQQRFKYVLVDEYQDTNVAQAHLLKYLCGAHGNVFAVGDANQCQPGETRVMTKAGEKALAELDPKHDVLLSYDLDSSRLVQADKFSIAKRPYSGELVVVRAGGQSTRTTTNHRWPLKRDGSLLEVEAQDLKIGDLLAVSDGIGFNWQALERLEETTGPDEVYSLDVAPLHNYVADGIVTNNSIYSFRQADIRNIIEFERAFPDAKILTLQQNYRSVNSILRVANNVILNNRQQGPKTVELFSDLGEGEPVRVLRVQDEREEARFVIHDLREFIDQGHNYQEAAVLYRTNAQSRALEESLLMYDVPYRIIGGPRFYERAEVKDAVAYLRALDNPADSVSVIRATQTPKRGLGLASLEKVAALARQEKLPFGLALRRADEAGVSGKSKSAAEKFYGLMGRLAEEKQGSVARLLQRALMESGYIAMLEAENSHEARGRLENLDELVGVAQQFDEQGGELSDFLQEVSLWSDQDKLADEENAVTLTTLHNAKGLEWGAVYLVGLEEGLLPHQMSLRDGDVEEERRLFYVGVTRAKERLSVTYAASRFLFGEVRNSLPSRFLPEMQGLVAEPYRDHSGYELDDMISAKAPGPRATLHGLEVRSGMGVRHKQFGEGIIVSVNGDETVTIAFRQGGERRLMLQYAPLELLG